MNLLKRSFFSSLITLLCLTLSAPSYSCVPVPIPFPVPVPAVVVAEVVVAVTGIQASQCLPPAESLLHRFSSGITINAVCNALGDMENTLSGCCSGSSAKPLLGLASSAIHEQTELNSACQVLSGGGVDFIKGFCNGGTGSPVQSCGADIKEIYPHLSSLSTILSGGTIPSDVCTALQNVLRGSTCCSSEVQTLFKDINSFTGGSMGTYVSALDTLCKDNNGKTVLDIIVGMGCNPSN